MWNVPCTTNMYKVLLVGTSKMCFSTLNIVGASLKCISNRKGLREIDLKHLLKNVRRGYASTGLGTIPYPKENEIHSKSYLDWTKYQPFSEMIAVRCSEAKRSILIQVSSQESYINVVKYLETFGKVNNSYFYTTSKVGFKNFVLVEFSSEEVKEYILKSGAFFENNSAIFPVASPFLWYSESTSPSKHEKRKQEKSEDVKLQDVLTGTSVSDQMLQLHNTLKISDLRQRLRFLTCHQLESAMQGVFPFSQAIPFGSSVNGLGLNSGDLDIFLNLHPTVNGKHESSQHKLAFHVKYDVTSPRNQLNFIANLMAKVLPGCQEVKSVLNAKVPIIKYHQDLTDVHCDLQISAIDCVAMSSLLWLLAGWDSRVAPFITTLKIWARNNNITVAFRPSPSITNFCLTVLGIFFLQKEGVLPSLHYLQQLASSDDKENESLFGCLKGYVQDLRVVPEHMWPSQQRNKAALGDLLLNFFHFYSDFEFNNNVISIVEGQSLKRNHCRCIYIVNPIITDLNIASHMSPASVRLFQDKLRSAERLLAEDMYSMKRTNSLKRVLFINSRNDKTQPQRRHNK